MRRSKFKLVLTPCSMCGRPITYCWSQEAFAWRPVELIDRWNVWVFDFNPIFDKTRHKIHWPCNVEIVKEREANRPEAAIERVFSQLATKSGSPEEVGEPEEGGDEWGG